MALIPATTLITVKNNVVMFMSGGVFLLQELAQNTRRTKVMALSSGKQRQVTCQSPSKQVSLCCCARRDWCCTQLTEIGLTSGFLIAQWQPASVANALLLANALGPCLTLEPSCMLSPPLHARFLGCQPEPTVLAWHGKLLALALPVFSQDGLGYHLPCERLELLADGTPETTSAHSCTAQSCCAGHQRSSGATRLQTTKASNTAQHWTALAPPETISNLPTSSMTI